MSGKDGLEFHDSGGDDVLFDQGSGQTHTFTNFPESAMDEDEETEDKSQLLKDESSKRAPSFWTFDYYQQFFDVETSQVFHRVAGSMLPLPKRNYLQIHIRPNPDLYGPFWICTTLVFTTAIAGNLANYLSSAGKDYHWRYDFHKVTFAATAIFSYWWLIPSVMYGFLWWRKSQAGFTFLEILCVYGYSLAIYIPISILWVINVSWFKWVLVIVGALLSGGVLVITFWPAVKEETKNVAAVFLGLIFLFHLGLAAGFVLYFFHVPPQAATATTTTTAVPTKAPEKLLQQNLQAGAPGVNSPKTGAARVNTPENGALLQNGAGIGQNNVLNDKPVERNAGQENNVNKEGNLVKPDEAGQANVLNDKPVQRNAGQENNVNKEGNLVQPDEAGQAKVAGAGNVNGGVNTSGQVSNLHHPAGNIAEEKVRTKLDTGEKKTNLEARDENTNLVDRKNRSKLSSRERRKALRDRRLA